MKSTKVIVLILLFIIIFQGCAKKEEGVINLRLESFAINLSPLKIADTESMQVASLLYSPLVAVNDDGLFEPRVAKSWKQVDTVTWEFEIQEDLFFSNKKPVKVSDIISTIENAMQPTSPWAWALINILHEKVEGGKKVKCTGLQIINENIFRIVLSKPDNTLLHKLDGPPGWIVPEDAKEGEYGAMPGCGPYIVKKITPDVNIVLERNLIGTVPKPNTQSIVFRLITDELQAGQMFENGLLSGMNISTPRLVEQMMVNRDNELKLKADGKVINIPAERIRIVIVNEEKLIRKGFKKEQVGDFINELKNNVNRNAIIQLGKGILAEPLLSSFPPTNSLDQSNTDKTAKYQTQFPKVKLTLLTESDSYSDLIAAIVSKTKINNIEFTYSGIDKSLLINSLVNKDYELISILIDANIKTPEYWMSFFEPGNPFSVFGKQINELSNKKISNKKEIEYVGQVINSKGNWIPLVKERRIFVFGDKVTGVRFTLTGQPRFEKIGFLTNE